MNTASEIEVSPAPPLQIPRVEVWFRIPRAWKESINATGPDPVIAIERWLARHRCQVVDLRICDDFYERFGRVVSAHKDKVSRAMTGPTDRVGITLNRGLWDLVVEAASNLCESPQTVLLVMLSWAMEREQPPRETARILAARSKRLAAETPPPGKVVAGPWKTTNHKKSKLQPKS